MKKVTDPDPAAQKSTDPRSSLVKHGRVFSGTLEKSDTGPVTFYEVPENSAMFNWSPCIYNKIIRVALDTDFAGCPVNNFAGCLVSG